MCCSHGYASAQPLPARQEGVRARRRTSVDFWREYGGVERRCGAVWACTCGCARLFGAALLPGGVWKGRFASSGLRRAGVVVMTGKCLLCGFDFGRDDNGHKRTGSHSQRTCALKSFSCLHHLPPTHPFHKAGTCYLKDCSCLETCSKCRRPGHRVGTLVLSSERYTKDNKTGNITRRRGAPPLTKSDFTCPWLHEPDVAEWVRVQHAACWQDWREAQELAASAARLAANVHEVGWDVVEAANVMQANGIAAATNGAENRPHFEAMVAAGDEPGQSAVGAALVAATGGAAAVLREGGGRAGRGVRGAAAASGRGRGRAAAAAASAVAVRQRTGAATRALPAPGNRGNRVEDVDEVSPRRPPPSPSGRRIRGRVDVRGDSAARGSRGGASSATTQSGRGGPGDAATRGSSESSRGGGGSSVFARGPQSLGSLMTAGGGLRAEGARETGSRSDARMQREHTSLMHSNAMRAADGVSRLIATGSGSTDRVLVQAAAAERAGVYADMPSVAAPVSPATPFHLRWKTGERCRYEGVSTFECPAISLLSPEQLARKVFRGALREQAAVFPAKEQEFVDAAIDNFLIGMNIT